MLNSQISDIKALINIPNNQNYCPDKFQTCKMLSEEQDNGSTTAHSQSYYSPFNMFSPQQLSMGMNSPFNLSSAKANQSDHPMREEKPNYSQVMRERWVKANSVLS
jgi:hypothetical protein